MLQKIVITCYILHNMCHKSDYPNNDLNYTFLIHLALRVLDNNRLEYGVVNFYEAITVY